MHLLSFAKKFLMLYAKLSNIHILQGTLPTYLTIHIFAKHFCHLSTLFWMSFLLYVHILFTYMVIHLRGNFMLYIHTYLHSFEKQFHVTHSLERQFLYYLFTFLKGNFMSYVPILGSIFVPYSTYMHTCKVLGYLFYIHMYMVNKIFTPSRYKEIIMVQPKPSGGLKGKPHQHALIFMSSCIQNQRLGFLGLSHISAFTLTSARCPRIQKWQPCMHKPTL